MPKIFKSANEEGASRKLRRKPRTQVEDQIGAEPKSGEPAEPVRADQREDDGAATVLLAGSLSVGAVAGLLLRGGNHAPILTLQGAIVTQHDQSVSAVFSATDREGDALTFAVTSGAHGSASIASGAIIYTPQSGYVGPDSVMLTVSDPKGGRSSQILTVEVRDDTPPKFTSATNAPDLAENSGAGQVVYRASTSDASPVAFALKAHGDADTLAIDAGTGAVTLLANPNFAKRGSYSFTVVATDARGNSSEQSVTLQILDNTPPKFTSPTSGVDLVEGSGAGQVVYRAIVTDASTYSFSLKPSGDAGALSLDTGSGAVTLLANPDFGKKASYSFTVVAMDARGNSSEQAVSLKVLDGASPKFTSGPKAPDIVENSGWGQVVYRAIATDATPITYALKSAGDASAFTIASDSGAVTLKGNPDYESKSLYEFTVLATDAAGNGSEQTVSLSIIDEFEDVTAPVFTSPDLASSVNEYSGARQVIYRAVATDAAPISFSLKGNEDFASFSIDAATGDITLLPNPDYEVKAGYAFTVIATDQYGNVSEKRVSLAVNDVEELSVFSTASGFSLRTALAGTVKMSLSGVLGDYPVGTSALAQQAMLKKGFLSLTSSGASLGSTSQYVVLGTAGADTHDARSAGLQVDYIYGGAGNDTLRGGAGDDILNGAAGDDDLYGDENADLIYGGDGNDDIEAGEDDDTVYGGLGDDTIDGGSTGGDTLYGEGGDDRFLYKQSADLFTDGSAVDRIDGGSGSNTIVIGELTPTHEYMFEITVEESFARIANVQRIEAARETMDEFSLTLNDNAYEAGLRVIDLSNALHLAVISNVIDVSAETGVANGYTLVGHGGSDRITGGAGVDNITGGVGADTLTGGVGNDVFIYTASGETLSGAFTDGGSTAGMDVIADAALGDFIDLWDVFSAAPTIGSAYLTSAQANYVAVVRGSYVPAGQTFTSGSGVADNDYLLQWSDGTLIHGVILKDWGTSAPSLSVNPSGDQITFADVTAPTMVSASYSGTEVVITYSEPLSGTPEAYDYTLGGTMTYIRSASLGSGANSNKVFLTLYNSASSGSITSIAYNANSGTANSVQDVALNAAPTQTLASGAIAYGDFTAPSIVSAEYEGSTLTLYYSETLAGSVEVGDFTVSLSNSTQATISSGSISGKTVVLSTSSPLAANSITSLSYSATSGAANSIKDAASPANSAPDQTLSTGITSLFSALSGRSVSGTSGSDKFVMSVGDTGVSIGGFTSGTDKVNVDALETYNAGGFNFTFTGPGNSPAGIPEGTLTFASGGTSGAADTAAGAAAYLSTVAAWNSNNMPSGRSGYFVVVDDNSTGLFKFVSDGLNEIEVGELTLIATIGSQTVTSDYVFA